MLDLGEAGAARRARRASTSWAARPTSRSTSWASTANVRDEFSRVVYGARVSLQVGFVTVGFAIVIGIGHRRRRRLPRRAHRQRPDAHHGRPPGVPGPAPGHRHRDGPRAGPDQRPCSRSRIVAIPIYARVMRASVLSVRETDYVTASRALGESRRASCCRRVLPNALTPLIVQGTLGIGGADPRGRGALVHRPRRPAADGRVGLDDRPRAQPVLLRAAPDLLPGHRDHPHASSASTCSATACATRSTRG